MIKLQQFFYGRDPSVGNSLLASSCQTYNEKVASLCSAIGTPDGSSVIEPFYINYVDGNIRYMIQGCPGVPDEGRMTLFFHCFAGDHQLMKKEGFGIGTLIHEKAFVQQCDRGPILEVCFDTSSYSLPWGNVRLSWNQEKIAIANSKPDIMLLTGLLKGSFDVVNWASFTFNPLDNFRIYIWSQYSPKIPSDRKIVYSNGELFANIKSKSTDVQLPSIRKCDGAEKRNVFLTLFIISLILNIVCLFSCLRQKSDPQVAAVIKPSTKEVEIKQPTTVVKPSTPAISRESVIAELRDFFLKKYPNSRIEGAWDDVMNSDEALKIHYARGKTSLVKVKGYVDFVNNEILNNQGEKK